MSFKHKTGWLLVGTVCLALSALTGCSSKDSELETFIKNTKKETGGRVEPLPELKPYESYAYESSDMRSPFMPGGSGASCSPDRTWICRRPWSHTKTRRARSARSPVIDLNSMRARPKSTRS